MSAWVSERLGLARTVVRRVVPEPVEVGMVLGTGLDGLADRMIGGTRIPYAEIPGVAGTTAPGHAGQLVVGELFGIRCALMEGRLHLYEGWSPQEIVFPIYLLCALGAQSLIVTNAAGALNPDFAPGDMMLIEDHLNFTGVNPLTGPNDDWLGQRFPDMSRAYDPEWQACAREIAGSALRAGVYAGISGPSLETSAERRFLRNSGGDAVGMSTVIEVIAAAHTGLRVLGLSAITNSATGGPEQQPGTIEEVLENAAVAGGKMAKLLETLIPEIARRQTGAGR
jgi:purine-nucleoside phosphorylase